MRLSKPPFPPEHGSWALMASAVTIGTGAGPAPVALTTGLLVMAAFAANMGRGALAAAMRPRPGSDAASWAILWGGLALSTALGLLIEFGDWRLLLLAPVASLIVVAHVGMGRIKTTRRFDRTLAGELIGALGIALLAPASYLTAGGASVLGAGLVWLAACAQSVSGILHVRAIIGSLRLRKDGSTSPMHPSAAASAVFHVLLILALVGIWNLAPNRDATSAVVAYVPLLARSAFGLRRRTKAPHFTRVGIAETALSLWCAGWTAHALRSLGLA